MKYKALFYRTTAEYWKDKRRHSVTVNASSEYDAEIELLLIEPYAFNYDFIRLSESVSEKPTYETGDSVQVENDTQGANSSHSERYGGPCIPSDY